MFLPHCSRTKKRQIVSCQKRYGRNSFLSLEDPARTRNARRIWPNSKSERYDFSPLLFSLFLFFLSFLSLCRKTSIRPERAAKSTLTQRCSAPRPRMLSPEKRTGTIRTQKLVRGNRLITRKKDLRGRVRDYTAETLSRPSARSLIARSEIHLAIRRGSQRTFFSLGDVSRDA